MSRKVEITWIDSKGVTSAWEFKDELEPLEPCECRSVGYLIEDNKEYKTIAQSDSKEQVMGRLTIPAACIKKMRYLK